MEDQIITDNTSEEADQPAGVRRTLTLRSNAARQVAVNFMPSRQLPHNTLRLRRNNSEHNALLEEIEAELDAPDGDVQADRIVREMEQHDQLMQDDPAAEELRREALRDLPQGLTMKRHVRAKLSASVSLRSKRRPISMWRRLKYRTSFAWKRMKDRFRDFVFSIELWYEAIRNIEGQFGSAVGSYFHFLRWLFTANVILCALVLAFIVVPQILHDQRNKGETHSWGFVEFITGTMASAVSSYFHFLRWLFTANVILCALVLAFIVVPQILHDQQNKGETHRWGFVEFITGTGGFGNSLLFYGHYYSGNITTVPSLSYNMPFAYFFTMGCLYLVIFAVLCYRTAYSYRRNFVETAGGLKHVFSNKVFCGWDYGIVSHHAAALNAASLYNEFKELLNEQNKNKDNPSFCTSLGRNLTNILINCLVLSMIVGLEYGIWRLLGVKERALEWEVYISLIATVVVAVAPAIFNLIVKLEFYSPRTALYVTLGRTWLLDVGTLMVLFYYWTRSGDKDSFGQEAYRLVLYDSLVSLFLLPLIEIVRYLIYKFYSWPSPPQFSIAYNSLTLIYNQALVWFSLYFSPLLAVAVTVKMLLLFYVKRTCARAACTPKGKIWRAAQTQTVMYMLVTLSLFTTLFGFGSLFFGMSSQCGPFQNYDKVYEVLTEGVLRLSHNQTAYKYLTFVTRPGVLAFSILFLCVAVYYMRAKARAQHSMVQLLRHMLVLQAKDKDFLLNAIAKVSNGEWLYSPKPDEDEGPNSHTWKYL
ncbi:TMC domain-containing protein [Phthorimaea operculella]|nr:TMC domain-containing protein [Phthorimaea operculella]